MTDSQTIERGILGAISKLILIVLILGLIGAFVYGAYVNSESYQDQKAQEHLAHDLEHIR